MANSSASTSMDGRCSTRSCSDAASSPTSFSMRSRSTVRILRELPLLDRKRRLRELVPFGSTRILYADHLEGRGRDLFEAICRADLEGVIAKHVRDTYRPGAPTTWLKIKNRDYSQARDPHELFERHRRNYHR